MTRRYKGFWALSTRYYKGEQEMPFDKIFQTVRVLPAPNYLAVIIGKN